MKTYRISGKIVSCNRLNNSVNRNPCWQFFLLADGSVYKFKTKTDSLCGYLFKPNVYCEAVVDYHITVKGNLIADAITIGKYKGV